MVKIIQAVSAEWLRAWWETSLRYRWRRFVNSPRRLRLWFVDPFVLKRELHEHTLIEHRAVPHRLRVTRVQSAQERLDSGTLDGSFLGRIHLTETLTVNGNGKAIVNAHLECHMGAAAITVPPADSTGPDFTLSA